MFLVDLKALGDANKTKADYVNKKMDELVFFRKRETLEILTKVNERDDLDFTERHLTEN